MEDAIDNYLAGIIGGVFLSRQFKLLILPLTANSAFAKNDIAGLLAISKGFGKNLPITFQKITQSIFTFIQYKPIDHDKTHRKNFKISNCDLSILKNR